MDVVGGGWGGGPAGPSSPPRAYPACLLRSHAPLSSRTKGAGTWWLARVAPAPPPGHPPLVSLRSLAPPYAEAKGARWCTPLSCGRKGRERSERGMRGDGWGAAWSDGVGVRRTGPASPPRAYPACLLRSHAPLSSRTKGHPPLWIYAGAKGAMDSCLRRNDGGVRRRFSTGRRLRR